MRTGFELSGREAKEGCDGKEGKHLGFSLGDEEYGIGILNVREILGMMRITPIPQRLNVQKGSSIFEARSFRPPTFEDASVWAGIEDEWRESVFPPIPARSSL